VTEKSAHLIPLLPLRLLPASDRQWLHPGADAVRLFQFHAAEIVTALEVDPELRFHPEKQAEGVCRFGIDRALAFDDFVDRRAGNPGALGELELGKSEAVEKLLLEDVSGRGGKDGFLKAPKPMEQLSAQK
jgi:hypothetical protein